VIRAGVWLPFVLAYGLAPREPASLAVAGLATLGLVGLLRMRTWGLLAIAGAGVLTMTLSTHVISLDGATLVLSPVALGALLVSTTAPFARPMLGWIRGAV